MKLLRRLNTTLAKTTGFEVRRARSRSAPARAGSTRAAQPRTEPQKAAKPAAPTYRAPENPEVDRLLRRPVFILSSVRSGSTLLRLLLDGHSQLHAPHELHIRRLKVTSSTKLAGRAMQKLGLERTDLEHLLWDRVLHRELAKSGKSFIVEKTPSNAFDWQRIVTAWPDARFIFLLRHPASIAASWHESDPEKRSLPDATEEALRYMRAVQEAREGHPGHTVRYEDVTADPHTELQRICEFLEIDWEPGMVEYGDRTENTLERGLGDWRDKIRSGTVQPGRELPDLSEVPQPLREMCELWGYVKEKEQTPAG